MYQTLNLTHIGAGLGLTEHAHGHSLSRFFLQVKYGGQSAPGRSGLDINKVTSKTAHKSLRLANISWKILVRLLKRIFVYEIG